MRYQVKGIGKGSEVVALVLEAATPADAHRLAEHQGLRVLGVRSAQRLPTLRRRRREAFPLVLFSQELATLLNAGLALIDALESLSEKETESQSRRTLAEIVRLLYEGKSFSQALEQFPAIFPDLYVALVRSSEKTGSIGNALDRYVAYRTRLDDVRQKVVSASIYPALLFFVGCAVLLFLIGYVVPKFSLVFEDMGADLPWLSRVLLATGQMLEAHRGTAILVGLLGIAGLVALARRPEVRRALGRLVEAVPAARERLLVYELARFYRSLGILLQGGIPIVTALGMVRGLLGITVRARLDLATQRIREGQALSSALAEYRLSTPVSLRMLRAGEQSGNLGEMMERTADFYDKEMNRWVEWFVRLFEPILMTLIGLVIGVIVILMYIPIFELASSIQ